MEIPQQEKVFYQDANVIVTQSRFIAGGKTYAIRNISHVSFHKIDMDVTGPTWLIIIGVLILICNIFAPNIWWILVGVILLIFAIKWIIEQDYSVRISINAGEVNSIVSKDQSYIQEIVDALNDAIIQGG